MANCYNDCIHCFVCQYANYDEFPSVQQLKDDCRYCVTDVVPRAEVEKLREINSLLTEAGQEWQKRYENLAREIFAEIEKTLNRKIARSKPQFERLNDKENSLSIWGYKDMGYFQGVIGTCEDIQDLLAELKKKYSEGEG